jgi:hypothetical protein
LIARSDVVSESSTEYNAADEYEYRDAEYEYRDAEYEYRDAEYEYRDAEYEYEHEEDKEPEPRNAPKDAASFFSRSMSPARPR